MLVQIQFIMSLTIKIVHTSTIDRISVNFRMHILDQLKTVKIVQIKLCFKHKLMDLDLS